MKKLALLILSFTLSSQVFANIPQEYLDRAWKIEKNYFLAVTTGSEGEHTIGKWPYGRLADKTPTFYVSIKKCESERCFQSRDEVYNSAIAFAKNYNDLMRQNGLDGKYHISVSDKGSMWGGIPILLTDELSSRGRWNCSKGTISGNFAGCKIKILIGSHLSIPNIVSHEMLNVLGIQDTEQRHFDGCISSDYVSDILTPQKLCEVEKQAIIFALEHLRPGMRKGSVESAFDKHWKASDFTYALARELEYLANI